MNDTQASVWILAFGVGVNPVEVDPTAPIYEVLDGPAGFMVIGDQPPSAPLADAAMVGYEAELISDLGHSDRPTSHLVVVGFPVPDDAMERFDDWYETEHGPLLLGAEDWMRVRRYRVRNGNGPLSCIAVHALASLDAMDSPQRQEAGRGPKRMLMAAEEWYARSGRWTCRPVSASATY